MIGYSLVTRIRRLEVICDRLGFKFAQSKYGNHIDRIALQPKDIDSLPLYTREAELFVGTLDEVENWITGVLWARDYDRMLFGNKHDTTRDRKEQTHRNKNLIKIIKGEKVD